MPETILNSSCTVSDTFLNGSKSDLKGNDAETCWLIAKWFSWCCLPGGMNGWKVFVPLCAHSKTQSRLPYEHSSVLLTSPFSLSVSAKPVICWIGTIGQLGRESEVDVSWGRFCHLMQSLKWQDFFFFSCGWPLGWIQTTKCQTV